MRALTVEPGRPNSIQLEDVAPPPASDGDVLVRALALGICGTDREIVAGAYGWAPEGAQRLIIGHESLGRVEASARRQRLCARRPRGRHRAPARSGALSRLRRRRMGHVPQRPLHRARHQAAQRLRRRAVSRRTRFPRQARSRARQSRRADGADQHRRQGLGTDRAHRRAQCLLASARGAGHRRRPGRPAGGAARPGSAATRCTCSIASPTVPSPRWCAISAPPIIAAISASSSPTS